MSTCAYSPNVILILFYSVLGDPRIIADGMGSLDISFFDCNIFRKVTIACTSDLVVNFVNFFYGM